MVSQRLYLVTYEENGEMYQEIFPECALPDIEEIEEIEVLGRLSDEYVIIKNTEPDEPSKEPIPIESLRKKA